MKNNSNLGIILAAGRGSRLKKITKEDTKCMLEVDGTKLIDLYIDSLISNNCLDIIIVTGHGSKSLTSYLQKEGHSNIHYVHNTDYAKTNNIYSLKLAFDYIRKNKFEFSNVALFESDIWIDKVILNSFLSSSSANAALVSSYEYWMDGTCVEADDLMNITSFVPKSFVSSSLEAGCNLYKTVNIYRFCSDYVNSYLSKLIDAYIEITDLNSYYEDVIRLLISFPSSPTFKAWEVSPKAWHEIDDEYDLLRAETTASLARGNNQHLINQFGGFWKYSWIRDINLLVNPHFPPEEMCLDIANLTSTLMRNYPSSQKVICQITSKTLSISPEYIVVGNGASEIISHYFNSLTEKWQIIKPAFLEYERVIGSSSLKYITSINDADVFENVILVNPNNPDGSFYELDDVLTLAKRLEANNKVLFYDESFSAFSDYKLSLLSDNSISDYPNLVVLKSLGKSYGVPGLRLGLLASSNVELVGRLRKALPIWNISSFAEAFLDLLPRYKQQYNQSLKNITQLRNYMLSSFKQIGLSGVHILPTQANFVMLHFYDEKIMKRVSNELSKRDLLFKFILPRDGIPAPSLRLAITDEKTCSQIIDAFRTSAEYEN